MSRRSLGEGGRPGWVLRWFSCYMLKGSKRVNPDCRSCIWIYFFQTLASPTTQFCCQDCSLSAQNHLRHCPATMWRSLSRFASSPRLRPIGRARPPGEPLVHTARRSVPTFPTFGKIGQKNSKVWKIRRGGTRCLCRCLPVEEARAGSVGVDAI